MTHLMADLCSGLGGSSQAMVDSENWLVIRVENNPKVLDEEIPHTVARCVKDVAWNRGNSLYVHPGDIDLLWASPPCRDFSRAFNAPAPTAERAGEEFLPDMSILSAVIELRRRWKPKFWCIENVIGAIPHFKPYLGEPSQIIGPFVLWTNLPLIDVGRDFEHSKYDNDPGSTHPLRGNYRARIPYKLSHAVMRAAECPTLEDFQ